MKRKPRIVYYPPRKNRIEQAQIVFLILTGGFFLAQAIRLIPYVYNL